MNREEGVMQIRGEKEVGFCVCMNEGTDGCGWISEWTNCGIQKKKFRSPYM